MYFKGQMHTSQIITGENNSRECDGREMWLVCGRGAYRDLVWKSEGKRPLEKPGHRREDNIKTDV
jgi:hypothetical protein